MVILHVGLEVLGEVADARGEERDLDLRRTRVALRALVFLDQLRFLRLGKSHRASLQLESRLFYSLSPCFLN
jgi:hypothetical protein